jgi:hypothetical protein
MDDILWADLAPEEQRAIAVLGTGMPVALCDAAAVQSLKRAGLVRAFHLTSKAARLRKAAILQCLAE